MWHLSVTVYFCNGALSHGEVWNCAAMNTIVDTRQNQAARGQPIRRHSGRRADAAGSKPLK
jgi:hypothetical protein